MDGDLKEAIRNDVCEGRWIKSRTQRRRVRKLFGLKFGKPKLNHIMIRSVTVDAVYVGVFTSKGLTIKTVLGRFETTA